MYACIYIYIYIFIFVPVFFTCYSLVKAVYIISWYHDISIYIYTYICIHGADAVKMHAVFRNKMGTGCGENHEEYHLLNSVYIQQENLNVALGSPIHKQEYQSWKQTQILNRRIISGYQQFTFHCQSWLDSLPLRTRKVLLLLPVNVRLAQEHSLIPNMCNITDALSWWEHDLHVLLPLYPLVI